MRYEVALATIEALMCKGFSEYPISIPSVQRAIQGKSWWWSQWGKSLVSMHLSYVTSCAGMYTKPMRMPWYVMIYDA